MKYLFIPFFLFILSTANAQYYDNDSELNRSLVTIDADARLDFGAFRADLCVNYNVSEKKIDYLAADIGMRAGDIFMTVEIAKIAHISIDRVVEVYVAHKNQGWGVMAKELGIKPGSPEFHALKASAKGNGNGKGGHGNGKGKGKGKS